MLDKYRKPGTEGGTEFEWWHNGEVTFEDEKRGIRDGSLFPYLKSVDIMHCPADNMRYNFVEQAEERPYNAGGSFFLNITPTSQASWYQARGFWWTWRAPVAINHGDSSIFGYCDGHAEVRKWRDSHTI